MPRLALIMALASTPAFADEVALVDGSFYEVIRDSGNLSGVVVVGVMAVTDGRAEGPRLEAWLPADWPGPEDGFCARVITANGLLEAVNDYHRLEGALGGTVALPFETTHEERWSATSDEEVAALVTPLACDAMLEPGETEAAAVALWNAPPETEVRQARLLVNSTGADEVYLFVGDEAMEATPCSQVEDRPTAVFDMTCEFDLPEGPGPTRIEINRVRSGELDEPQFLDLLHGG